ncbi:MAG: golvesin C-terminal-like domain-containing protein, partial [Planctomycetota bacterium]
MWAEVTGDGHDGDYQQTTGGSASSATWTFTDLTPGYLYRVSATWTSDSDRTADARYSVVSSANAETRWVLGTASLDQAAAPDDLTYAGTSWENLGEPYLLRGTTLSVQLSAGTDGTVVADAVRIERVGDWVAPTGIPTPEFGIDETHWMYADPQYT